MVYNCVFKMVTENTEGGETSLNDDRPTTETKSDDSLTAPYRQNASSDTASPTQLCPKPLQKKLSNLFGPLHVLRDVLRSSVNPTNQGSFREAVDLRASNTNREPACAVLHRFGTKIDAGLDCGVVVHTFRTCTMHHGPQVTSLTLLQLRPAVVGTREWPASSSCAPQQQTWAKLPRDTKRKPSRRRIAKFNTR